MFTRFVPNAGSVLAASVLAAGLMAGLAAPPAAAQPRSVLRPGVCALGPRGAIKHVIYLQFDNTHYTRDNRNVPSDLQLMPNLLHFITGAGTLVTHEHTPLIAHTADDFVTSESGLYGADQGIPIANEYRYYTPGGGTSVAGSFAFWRDPIVDYTTSDSAPIGDHTPTMIGATGKTAPAPWVPYTRAGCDFGSVAAANTDLENLVPDVPLVYGAHSAQAKEAENPKLANKAAADFEGILVHCARRSAVCRTRHGGRPDLLPGEPRGYHGYRALFGNKVVAPVISPSGPVRNLNGAVIKDSSGDVGFPGYNGMTGTNALAYTLDMQTHGVPVTYTYLSDLHESWKTGNPFGPGEAGYVRQARLENAAFGTFFTGLAAHGITRANTLFIITADEGDHFVGGQPSPAGCNGVTVACHYSKIGEVDGNLTALLARKGISTPFDVNADSAPVFYVHGQPASSAPQVRAMERAAALLRGSDLVTGKTVPLTRYLAGPAELNILHMITADPKRTPTFIDFANPDFYLSSGTATCKKSCFSENPTEAWNHGDVNPQINTTWLGVVGPDIARRGVDNRLWSDHTSIQPTMMAALRLRDDFRPDGRVLTELLAAGALPASARAHRGLLLRLGRAYTAINAPVGPFGLATLRASTRAPASANPDNHVYTMTKRRLGKLGRERDQVAGAMCRLLLGADF
ncbi:MAG: hypothetical protein ACR2FU_18295, partial [Streptosporangiaceae bacterium]